MAQIRRRHPHRAGQDAADHCGGSRAPPPELPHSEQHEHGGQDHESRACRRHVDDVGEERRCEKKQDRYESRARTPEFGCLPDERESANREHRALHDVILDQHAQLLAAPRQTRREHKRPGDDQQHDRGRRKPMIAHRAWLERRNCASSSGMNSSLWNPLNPAMRSLHLTSADSMPMAPSPQTSTGNPSPLSAVRAVLKQHRGSERAQRAKARSGWRWRKSTTAVTRRRQ